MPNEIPLRNDSEEGRASKITLEHILQELRKTHHFLSEELKAIHARLIDLAERLSKRTKNLFTVEEVADLTGRTPFTIRRWIKMGRLQAQRLREGGPKGRLLIPREELEHLISQGKGTNIPETIL
jgi:excisionase family DNA binding protein